MLIRLFVSSVSFVDAMPVFFLLYDCVPPKQLFKVNPRAHFVHLLNMYSHHLNAISHTEQPELESVSIWEHTVLKRRKIKSIYFINSVTKWAGDRIRLNEMWTPQTTTWKKNKTEEENEEEPQIYLNLMHVHRPKLTSHWAHIRWLYRIPMIFRALTQQYKYNTNTIQPIIFERKKKQSENLEFIEMFCENENDPYDGVWVFIS